MNKSYLHRYINRWKMIEVVQKDERQRASIEERWQQLNALYGLALELGLLANLPTSNEEQTWQRWTFLRNQG